jgi:hypothetical protein
MNCQVLMGWMITGDFWTLIKNPVDFFCFPNWWGIFFITRFIEVLLFNRLLRFSASEVLVAVDLLLLKEMI